MTARCRRANAPAALAAGALLLVVALVRAGAADGIAGLPEGTLPVAAGIPPYAPDIHLRAEEDLLAWSEAMRALARERIGTVAGGDLLFSAAAATEDRLGRRLDAAVRFDETLGAYPASEPLTAVAAARAARLWLGAGNAEGASSSIARLERWRDRLVAGARPAADATDRERARWAAMVGAVEGDLPLLRAQARMAEGSLPAAADELEALAARPERAALATPPADPGDLWERAARLRYRAGDRDRARDDATRAIETAPDDRTRADRTFRRLHLVHGLLAKDGSTPSPLRWPPDASKDAFLADFVGALRGLAGNPHVGPHLLANASAAFLAGRPEAAVEIYRFALDDPALLERARGDEALARGLLTASDAAATAGRFDDARRFLDAVERLGAVPREETDRLRARVSEEAAFADAARARSDDAAARRDEPSSRPSRGAGPPGSMPDRWFPDRDGQDVEEPEPPRVPADEEGPDALVVMLFTIVAILVVIGLARAVGARRRGG